MLKLPQTKAEKQSDFNPSDKTYPQSLFDEVHSTRREAKSIYLQLGKSSDNEQREYSATNYNNPL